MPSAVKEEPRYDGLDTQQEQQPIPSGKNGSTCSNRAAADISEHSDLGGDNDLVPQTHASEGYELSPSLIGATTSVLGSILATREQDQTIPKTSDITNGQSSIIDQPADHYDNVQPTDNQNDIQHGSQEVLTGDNQNGGSSSLIQHSSNHDNNNNRNRHHQATSSTNKLANRLNNIVTKISKVLASTSLAVISPDRHTQEEQQQQPKNAFGNRRALEKTWKLMDKVVKCCQNPRMKLNNSPPFILDILPETFKHLKLIHAKHDLQQVTINDNEYSKVFLRNLQNRCEQTLKLFKDSKDDIYNEDSEYRQKLTRNTLVFNHILSELKALFPNGSFIGDKYLITKKESAGEFWKNSFGSDIMVDWKTFYHALQQVHSIDSSFFSLHALKQTIDLTCDDHISIFEFDVFTRLFQPWSTLLKNWQTLAVTHPGYKAFLTYDELKARLQKHINKPGSYVFRLSCTRLGQWAIGYVTQDGQILQTIVQNISLSQALTETQFYVYPDGKEEDPELRERLRSGMQGDERNVTVTEEQYEIYCGLGNSFQTCKICFVNDKEIRVEPCNHLLCTSCLVAWQETEGQGCPYCRTEIKETVQITMDLPKSSDRNLNR